mmetsp:Transcript_38063/g.67993  ORF Transcript_38063/g.67993 Transcript_38063/m.67993 type:complete len:82 (+) Transcript_38063:142-387(+)
MRDALETLCQILGSATCDGEFEWPEGLLKSWLMIRQQGDEARYMGMYSTAKKQGQILRNRCFWTSKRRSLADHQKARHGGH